MKKTELLNSSMARVVSLLGHGDSLVIADAGLPIPKESERIDLALIKGIPSFLETLQAISTEMCIERVAIAQELPDTQPEFCAQVLRALYDISAAQNMEIQIDYLSHTDFKLENQKSMAVIRTGECTPYANIQLFSGVVF